MLEKLILFDVDNVDVRWNLNVVWVRMCECGGVFWGWCMLLMLLMLLMSLMLDVSATAAAGAVFCCMCYVCVMLNE